MQTITKPVISLAPETENFLPLTTQNFTDLIFAVKNVRVVSKGIKRDIPKNLEKYINKA